MPDAASPSANRFRDASSVEELLGQAIGYGSMCWENPGGAGVFDSDEASRGIHEAMERYRELTGTVATTVEQWRVSGVRDLGFPPTETVFKSSDTRWDGEPERAARRFIEEAGEWAEGPWLDHRVVGYPRWRRVT